MVSKGGISMNREQKRDVVKKAKKKGIKESEAKAYANIISEGAGTPTPAQDITEGEKIKLNVEAIKNRKNYKDMSKMYKEFVEANADTIFTAHVERKTLISLNENQNKWLFWCGDLIKVKEETEDNVHIN